MLSLHKQTVTVCRLKLLQALKNNLEIHISEYKEATEDYKVIATCFAQQLLHEVSHGNFKNMVFKIQEPISYESKYQDIIDMLEISVVDRIELDSQAFKAYFKNEWDWTSSFKNYSASLKSLN